jgi:hypothetical protein
LVHYLRTIDILSDNELLHSVSAFAEHRVPPIWRAELWLLDEIDQSFISVVVGHILVLLANYRERAHLVRQS